MSADSERVRLQRFLSMAGVASRRKAEDLISAGQVRVNGQIVTELGSKVHPRLDRVDVDGRRVHAEDHVWLLLNKPKGVVSTTSDPEGRQTVIDVVGEQGVRLYPVGRLDYHTEGAMLITNDGALSERLAHPRFRTARVYHVKLKGLVTDDDIDPLRTGVTLDTGERVKAEADLLATTGKHTWIEMTLRRGLNHQIHRMAEAIGRDVLKLIRISFADLTIEGLKPGEHRPLTQREVDALRRAAKLPGETKRVTAAEDRRSKHGAAAGKKSPSSKPRSAGRGRTDSERSSSRAKPAGERSSSKKRSPSKKRSASGERSRSTTTRSSSNERSGTAKKRSSSERSGTAKKRSSSSRKRPMTSTRASASRRRGSSEESSTATGAKRKKRPAKRTGAAPRKPKPKRR